MRYALISFLLFPAICLGAGTVSINQGSGGGTLTITGSTAASSGGSGTLTSVVSNGNGITVTNPAGPTVTLSLSTAPINNQNFLQSGATDYPSFLYVGSSATAYGPISWFGPDPLRLNYENAGALNGAGPFGNPFTASYMFSQVPNSGVGPGDMELCVSTDTYGTIQADPRYGNSSFGYPHCSGAIITPVGGNPASGAIDWWIGPTHISNMVPTQWTIYPLSQFNATANFTAGLKTTTMTATGLITATTATFSNNVAIGTTNLTTAQLFIVSPSTVIPLVVQDPAGGFGSLGSMDLTEWRNTAGVAVSSVAADGSFITQSTSSCNYFQVTSPTMTLNGTTYTWLAGSGGAGQFLQNNGGTITSATPAGGGSGIVSPGTFTWTNNFGISASTISVSSLTVTAQTLGIFYQSLFAAQSKLGPFGESAPFISNSTSELTAAAYFDDTSTQAVSWTFRVHNYDGRRLTADIVSHSSGTANYTCWEVYTSTNYVLTQVGTQSMDLGTQFNVGITTAVVVNPNQLAPTLASVALSNTTVSNGDMLTIKLERETGGCGNTESVGQARMTEVDIRE